MHNILQVCKSNFSVIHFENPLYISSEIYTSEMLQENSENHGNAFFHTK